VVKIRLDTRYRQVVVRFFEKNPGIPHQVAHEAGELVLEVDTTSIPEVQARQVQLYFSYVDFFEWQRGGIENVIFWERPGKFDQMAADFILQTQDLTYDLIAPLEARGFLLAGILAAEIQKPILPIRKHKKFYDRYPGSKIPFTNWKGEEEAVFVFQRADFVGKRVLVVDDLIETGNSLRAALEAPRRGILSLRRDAGRETPGFPLPDSLICELDPVVVAGWVERSETHHYSGSYKTLTIAGE